MRILITVIHMADKDIFKGNHSPMGEGKGLAGREDLLEGVGLVDRHEVSTGLVIGGIERNRQIHRDVLPEAAHLEGKAAGGEGHPCGGRNSGRHRSARFFSALITLS